MTGLEMKSYTILDVRIHAVHMKEAIDACMTMTADGAAHMIATANAEMLMLSHEDPELCRILNACDMVVPDGAGVLWAGGVLNYSFPERVAGIDLMTGLLKQAAANDIPVYFLGGAPGIAKQGADRFMDRYGRLNIAGIRDGYFKESENEVVIRDIREKGTKLLFVGMGVPKQEKWIYGHLEELGPVVAMGIGGSFDVLAGTLKRAPLWMQEHRLEWAYRLYLQPTRISRMLALPRFMHAVKQWKKQQRK